GKTAASGWAASTLLRASPRSIAATSGATFPPASESGPGRENQPSVIQVVSPSENTSVAVPLQPTVAEPAGGSGAAATGQARAAGGRLRAGRAPPRRARPPRAPR